MENYVSPPFQVPQSLMDDIAKLGPLLNAGTKVIDLGKALISKTDGKRPSNVSLATASYVIFCKGFMTYQTIQTMCRLGCGSDSLSLCASLFENYIDICFIAKTKKKWADKYLEFEQVEKYYRACQVLGHKRLPHGWRNQYTQYRKELHPQVKRLLGSYPNKSSGWSQKSLKQRAKAVNHKLEYLIHYWVFCAHKHTLPMVAGGLVLKSRTGIDLVYSPNVKGVCSAAFYSGQYFLEICEEFQNSFDIDFTDQIELLRSEIRKAEGLIRKKYREICD